jgi:nucleotide-binding universal stress UspA family protein
VGLNVSVEYHLLEGEPAEEIVRLAKSNNIDLIIMGSHGRTGLSRLLMGSVAEQVVRRAECAVLTIKHPIHEKVQQTEKEKDYVVI